MRPLTALDGVPGLSPLDRRFADLMLELSAAPSAELALAAALTSRRVAEGHVCLDLAAVAGRPLAPAAPAAPPLPDWTRALRSASVVGTPGDFTPLVLDEAGRLYLYRYWEYEQTVARFARESAAEPLLPVDRKALAAGLARYFPAEPTDWQRVAAAAALLRRFLVISGGPGTGKTSTVVKILALLVEQPAGDRLRIALAAPTGKAAARLKSSLRDARGSLPASPEVLDRIPEEVSTVHRLLGTIRGSSRFRHHRGNPLPFDVVVVDEASMVDLPLTAKLVDALRPEARLLLLGDRDQLASVEAGAVLGDLCGGGRSGVFSPGLADAVSALGGDELPAAEAAAGLRDTVVLLRKSYRFGPESGIGRASRAVNAGEGEQALELLQGGSCAEASWVTLGEPGGGAADLAAKIAAGCKRFLEAGSPEEAFGALGRRQVLCALRRGPFGAEAVNSLAERALAAAGLIRTRTGSAWYRGRPVMVTVNDYALGLFNGDVGIALPDPDAEGELRVFFPAPDGGFRAVAPERLPAHETAYALTVHKSQGSEFDEVLLVLGDRPAPVVTRELLYTGMTRARKRVEVWGIPEAFLESCGRRIRRSSGLRDALWGA